MSSTFSFSVTNFATDLLSSLPQRNAVLMKSAKVKSLSSLPLSFIRSRSQLWGHVQGAPPMSCSSDDWVAWVSSLKTMKLNLLYAQVLSNVAGCFDSDKQLPMTAWPSTLEELETLLPHLWGALMTELPDFVFAAVGVDPLAGWGAISPVSTAEEKSDGALDVETDSEVLPPLEELDAREAALEAHTSCPYLF